MGKINEIIFKLGVAFRNNLLFNSFDFLKKSQYWDNKKTEEYQVKKFNELIQFAINNSSYLNEKYKNIDVRIKSIKDLDKIPAITKKELLEHNSDIQITQGVGKLIFSETSGSTGEPLIFYRTKEWDARHRAAQLRGYSWHGVKPWEKNGYFWGYDFSGKSIRKIKLLDFLLNRFRIFSYKKEEIIDFSLKLKKAKYLEGYSSMIYEVAKTLNSLNIKVTNLKMVKGTSEKIYDSYQEEVKKAFGKKMISEYGAAETGIIAFECKNGNMHITSENVIVEEEKGEVIVTNLLSKSFPIIRYKLGDSVKINYEKKCSCGVSHPIIDDVQGRVGKSISGFKNKYPSLTFYYIFKNLALNSDLTLNYQAIQNKRGHLIFYIDRELKDFEKDLVIKEAFKYFNTDIEVKISSKLLKRDYSKKFKDFISTI
ncbi:phenylacetate--CoA ligase family protein [Exiguobacterium sp. 9-2]|uniref:phenylacetate--CoA ligase family protein n=1 Tax=Exiguobacterium sp. 9-2 TaxID=3112419 RepID=UPI002E2FB36F|nr:hypothetical protein [Exiguobacterium sp. 9-2]